MVKLVLAEVVAPLGLHQRVSQRDAVGTYQGFGEQLDQRLRETKAVHDPIAPAGVADQRGAPAGQGLR